MRALLPLMVAVVVVASCKLGKSKEDSGAAPVTPSATASSEAAPDASVEDPANKATNASKVARFGDEEKVEPTSAPLLSATIARDAPGGGVVSTLSKGTTVIRLATRGKQILVTFPNPKAKTETLLGWIPDTAFVAQTVKSACKTDKDCPPFHTCATPPEDGDNFCLDSRSDEGGPCDTDTACITGLKCRTFLRPPNNVRPLPYKECAKACTSDGQCGTYMRCGPAIDTLGGTVCSTYAGKQPVGAACKVHGECVTPMLCFSGSCAKECDPAKPTCDTGFTCERDRSNLRQGKCVRGALAVPTPDSGPPAAQKVKCVLSSPPPCPAPHVKSPKGLCQLPCPAGDCNACDGVCQTGFCVAKNPF